MIYLGDFALSSSVEFKFPTHKGDGTPATLSGSPVISVYKNASTTETTTGVTLTVDYDSRTGMNRVVIDTSADGTFYSTGTDFSVVITTGTVDSISVVGYVIAHFSLNNRSALRPTTAGMTLDVTSTGEAGLDFSNIKQSASAIVLNNYTIPTITTYTGNTVQTGDSYARLGAPSGATISADITSSRNTTDSILNYVGTAGVVVAAASKFGYNLSSSGLQSITSWTVNIAGSITSVTNGVTVTTNNDKTGYSLTQTFPTNFSSLGINTSGHIIRVNTTDTVTDKAGYSLSQTFPTNFASLGINISGHISRVTLVDTLTTNSDKTGYSLTQTFPTNFSSLGINVSGHISRVTLVDTTTTNTDMRGTDSAALATTLASNISTLRTDISGVQSVVNYSSGNMALAAVLATDLSIIRTDISGVKAVVDYTSGNSAAPTTAQIWSYASRTLTDKVGYTLTTDEKNLIASGIRIELTTELANINTTKTWVSGVKAQTDLLQFQSGNVLAKTMLFANGTLNELVFTSGGISGIQSGLMRTFTLPTNFSILAISSSGYVTATNGGSSGGSSETAGDYLLSVSVSGNSPIFNASLQIRDSAGSGIVKFGRTNSAGDHNFMINSGNYKIYSYAYGYEDITAQAFTVTADRDLDLTMVPLSVTTPTEPALCNVNFYCFQGSGCTIVAEPYGDNNMIDNYLVTKTVTKGTTDGSGYAGLTLIKQTYFTSGGQYHITAKDIYGKKFHDRVVSIPNVSSINFEDI